MRGFRPMVASMLVLLGCTKLAGIEDDYTLGAGGSDAGKPDSSTGGVQNGGSGGSGGSGSNAGSGGVTGGGTSGGGGTPNGGSAGTPSGGTGGTSTCPVLAASGTFPTPGIGVLDTFDNGLASWTGNTANFTVAGGTLTLSEIDSSEIYYTTAFCPDQEVFVKALSIDVSAGAWILNLKAQDFNGCNQLEVGYDAPNTRLWVSSCTGGDWVEHTAKLQVTFQANDVIGARARADGAVEVYQNGTLILSTSVTSFSGYALGGYIGLETYGPTISVSWDDFGGGPPP